MTAKHKNLIFVALLLAIMLFYIFSGGSVGISLDFGEDALTLSASEYDWVIPYEQVQSLELTALPHTGRMIEGSDKRTLRCGTWENETWGEYVLCIDPRIDSCIVVTMNSGEVYVLNYENSDSTGQLHKMFTELLQSKDDFK